MSAAKKLEAAHSRLAVEPQEVVLGQIETADGRFGSDTAMGRCQL